MFSEAFLDQYYGIIAGTIFFLSYTSLLIYVNVSDQHMDVEDYGHTFIIIALLATTWLIFIPFILVVLSVVLYIKGVNRISQVYIKRIKDT